MADQVQFRVCPRRNVAAAYERFFRPSGSQLVSFYFDCGVRRGLTIAGVTLDRVVALARSIAAATACLAEESARALAAPYGRVILTSKFVVTEAGARLFPQLRLSY